MMINFSGCCGVNFGKKDDTSTPKDSQPDGEWNNWGKGWAKYGVQRGGTFQQTGQASPKGKSTKQPKSQFAAYA